MLDPSNLQALVPEHLNHRSLPQAVADLDVPDPQSLCSGSEAQQVPSILAYPALISARLSLSLLSPSGAVPGSVAAPAANAMPVWRGYGVPEGLHLSSSSSSHQLFSFPLQQPQPLPLYTKSTGTSSGEGPCVTAPGNDVAGNPAGQAKPNEPKLHQVASQSSLVQLDESASDKDEPGTKRRRTRKPRLVWTNELHQRFVKAVTHLGVANAVPKTILQLMNVEGMTRENVASHLQKYRQHLKTNTAWDCNTSQASGLPPMPTTGRYFGQGGFAVPPGALTGWPALSRSSSGSVPFPLSMADSCQEPVAPIPTAFIEPGLGGSLEVDARLLFKSQPENPGTGQQVYKPDTEPDL